MHGNVKIIRVCFGMSNAKDLLCFIFVQVIRSHAHQRSQCCLSRFRWWRSNMEEAERYSLVVVFFNLVFVENIIIIQLVRWPAVMGLMDAGKGF